MSTSVNQTVLAKCRERFTVTHNARKGASVREDDACTFYAPSFMLHCVHMEKNSPKDLDILNNLKNFYYWFFSSTMREIFFRRLVLLKSAAV